MTISHLPRPVLALGLACFSLFASAAVEAKPLRQAQDRPNVVLLFADDLGWSDVSIHPGGSIPTPHIDRLFRQGVELRNFMGWCVCSPTRAMLLTARHPFRVGTGPEVGGELALEETTIAEGFKANGYRTGIFGKWHNGNDPDTPEYRAAFAEAFKSMPNKKLVSGHGANAHGFDEAWVYYGGGADFFTRRTVSGRGPVSWWHNREFRPQDKGYTEDFITEHAIEFIRDNRERPFFCYVPFHIVHTPLQAKEADLNDVNPKVTDKTKRVYAAMVQAMDKNVATILAELDRLGLRDNTIVVFTSDNGATRDGSNLPFRGSKHTVYEGGTRLPTVIHWPNGKVTNGSWDGLCGALDLFPSLMAMADLKMPATRPLDGRNIWPALRDRTASPVEDYYWVWRNEDTIRTADWRLHRYFDRVELYDIRTDLGETRNLAKTNPKVVKSLTVRMDRWADSLDAALSHLPAKINADAKPAPEGEVLEVSVTVTEAAKQTDLIIVPFAGFGGDQVASDHVEYDVAIGPGSPQRGFFYTPFKGNDLKSKVLELKRGLGIDQFGREQVSFPEVRGGPGVWEHRVVGLCNIAPGILPRHGLVFKGGTVGTIKVYLDNLQLRHADGSTTPIWTDAKDTRFPDMKDTEQFKNIRVRSVPASAVAGKDAAASKPSERPLNLLFIITDQQRWDAMGCAGNPILKTPNLDRLARDGARFTAFYSACPVCVPARTAILTGHSLESNRVLSNSDVNSEDAAPFPSFDQILLRSGYRGEYHGKYHSPYKLALDYSKPVRWLNGKNPPPGCKAPASEAEAYRAYVNDNVPKRELRPGELMQRGVIYQPIPLDEFYGKPMPKRAKQAESYGRYEMSPEHTISAFTAREGLTALDRLKDGPFTLTISLDPPHPPMIVPEPYYSMYPPDQIPVPESINASRANSPYPERPGPLSRAYRLPTNIQQMTSIYYGMVSEVDDWVGKILQRLNDLGLRENTLVVFTSDHGEMLGDHGMHGKFVFHDGSARVPLLLRLPGKIPANTVIKAPASHLDLFPTILDYLGKTGHDSEGRNLRPLIEGREKGTDRVAVSEWPTTRTPGFMICDGRWKLLYGRAAKAPSLDALYDLQTDPHEMNNLIGRNPDREKRRAEVGRMKGLLIDWLTRVKSPHLESVRTRPLFANE